MVDLLQPVAPQSWRDRVSALRDQAPPWAPVAAAAAVVAAVVVAAVVAFLLFGRTPPPAPLTLPQAAPATAPSGAPVPAPASAPEVVTVHVAGQVLHPGVYAVAAGGRVADAVMAAGGPLPEADLDQLNLAARVADGDRAYVPKKGETPPPPTGAAAGPGSTAARSGPLDLNAATAEQLDVLPGVGPATARAIVDYRTRHGRYRSVTDLLEVPGIGPAKLEALRPLVRV